MKPENTSNRLSILVVDDEESIREGSERILTRMGYQVYKASRGSEGLEILGQSSGIDRSSGFKNAGNGRHGSALPYPEN